MAKKDDKVQVVAKTAKTKKGKRYVAMKKLSGFPRKFAMHVGNVLLKDEFLETVHTGGIASNGLVTGHYIQKLCLAIQVTNFCSFFTRTRYAGRWRRRRASWSRMPSVF